MRIGELSTRTGIPTRMLRYYEQQGLIDAPRAGNGYRDYDDDAVERAERVRGLVQAGLSTRMTRVVLDIEQQTTEGLPRECSRELAAELATELAALEARLACLSRSRDAVAEFLRRASVA
ncbi:MerR family transcriptional regulator [Microbacterium sp.]|uniref:MerR family transcriptional regulator n=1 Tax=Microbacterium sp. TaxID=51671 RepID=UPI003C749C54